MKQVLVKDLAVQCSYPMREPALAMSDCCRKAAYSAVEDPYGVMYYYRCHEHEGLFRGDEAATVVRRVPQADNQT
jgi:hypothetical protein